ncbi:hypothetical protein QYE76_068497 [Lolium multiflorum]|uniref:CCHC-type domain-containing protein n=1 Tax=Lolium multiflorum TaxID=4521 RepID=A0AAD8SEK0_LOLMU|nr:hypothetical protein QYE76_068497 [Lolium multiflorum]
MGKPRDTKIAILPSTTRKGTTLSTSALDSPSVISKLVSPPQASNAGTSAESENSSHNCDDASAVLDNDGSLGSFLDATIAKSRQIENTETPNENAATPVNSPESVEYSSDDLDEDYVELDDDFIEKCNATTDARKIKKLLAEHAVRYKLSPDPKFATSPINIRDKDYDFSLDLSHIAIVEKTPFCGTEKESVVEHMTELSTLSGLFSDDIKMRTYFVAKIFPFSLKDDAKTWYNNLPPGSIKSPKELLDVFFRKYFPASAQHAALQRIYNFDQEDGEKLPEAWARFCSLIRAQPDHDLEKHDLLDIFYSGLTIESRAYLDSCAGCVFRKRTPDDAEELLAKIGRNHDDWSTIEPTPTPIVKKRGMIKLNDEDMREAKKSLKEKGIKPEDVKNLPPIEDLCEITPPSSMIEDPLYPEGHPKRVEQDSQLTKTSAPSKKKKKKHKNVVESSEPVNDPNSISISDAETESGNEHDKDNDKDDTPDKEEIEKEPEKHAKNKKYTKEDFIAEKHGAVIDCNKGMVTFNVDDKEHTVYFPKRIDKDFEFHRSQTNPMVRYKIYNKTINLPFSDFCTAIRVPRWGSCEKIRGTPRELSNLYTMICNGRSFSNDGGSTLAPVSLVLRALHSSTNNLHVLLGSYWFDNLGFLLRKTCRCAHHTFLLGFPTDVYIYGHQASSPVSVRSPARFWTGCPGPWPGRTGHQTERQPAFAPVPSGHYPVKNGACPVKTRSQLRCSVELWEIILHGYREPQDPIRLTSTEFYNRQLNASARDKIRSGINRKLLDQVNDIGSAKELWDRIVVLQEGTDLIQSSLYETAKQEAHRFMIREGESVADAYARLGALRVRIKGLGAEKYDDGFEMNEGFIKSKVIAMIAVKQEDTNLALNLQIMTKSADLNSDDLVSYVAANENMAKAGKMLMAMNRVDQALIRPKHCCDPLYLWVIKTIFCAVAGEHSFICKFTWIDIVRYKFSIMGKPRDTKVAILPSTTRKGTTLSTSAALDSPSVISQLVSPPQTSRVGTSAESENSSDNFDDASTVLDNTGSLGPFLDATIARSRQTEITETPNENTVTPVNSPEIDDLDEDYVELDDDFIDKCNATTSTSNLKKLIAQHVVRYKLSPDPKFATSPINIKDKDYDFSLDLSHISIIEKTPFCGTEKESAVEHMNELSTLSSLFSDDVKMRTYFVAKIFPFSLKDDAKIWKRTPDEAEELLAKISKNHDDWSTPEPTPTPILKKRGMIELNDEDMREAKKSLMEKGIKSEDVKNLPPIEDLWLLDDFLTLIGNAGLTTYMEDEGKQYYMLTKIFVESFKFNNKHFNPTVAFKIYGTPVTMKLKDFCAALGIAPAGTAKKIEDNPRVLLELYREITNDDCRTIQRGKIRNIQLPAIKYFAYYLATSILGRENTSNISSYHLAFLIAALTGETPYHLGSVIARRLSNKGPIYGGIIASRILARLDLPLDPNDVEIPPVRLDIAAMKSHQFVTVDSSMDNIVYRMLFADGDEREVLLPQTDLFSIDRKPWSRSKEEVDEQLKIQGFHQQHDSEDAEPSYDYTVTYPARADHGGEEEYEIEEDEEMTSTSDIATDFAFFAKKYKGKLPMLLNDKKKKRTCYNCDEESHFANECPYEKRVDKPKFIKGVKPRLKPNPINDRYKRNKGRAFVGAEYLSDEEEEDEEKEAGVAGLAFSKPGSLFTYDYSKDYSTENDVGSSFMARITQDDDSDDSSSSTTVGSCLMARETKVMEPPPSLSSVLDNEAENQDELTVLKELYNVRCTLRGEALVKFDFLMDSLKEKDESIEELEYHLNDKERRFNLLRQELKTERCISQGLKQQIETYELDKVKDLETIERAQSLTQELNASKEELEVAHASLTRDLDHLERANKLVKDELKKLGKNHDLLQETYSKALESMNDSIVDKNVASSSTTFTSEHAKLVAEHVRLQEELSLHVETNTYLESLVTKYGLNYYPNESACEQATTLEENVRLKKELAKFTTTKSKMGLDDLLSKQRSNNQKYGLGYVPKPYKENNYKKEKPNIAKKELKSVETYSPPPPSRFTISILSLIH